MPHNRHIAAAASTSGKVSIPGGPSVVNWIILRTQHGEYDRARAVVDAWRADAGITSATHPDQTTPNGNYAMVAIPTTAATEEVFFGPVLSSGKLPARNCKYFSSGCVVWTDYEEANGGMPWLTQAQADALLGPFTTDNDWQRQTESIDYFVDPVSGTSGGAGTYADPVDLVSRLTLANNDRVAIRAGTTHNDAEIDIESNSGIVVSAYGSDKQPILQVNSVREITTTWSNVGGGVWETDPGFTYPTINALRLNFDPDPNNLNGTIIGRRFSDDGNKAIPLAGEDWSTAWTMSNGQSFAKRLADYRRVSATGRIQVYTGDDSAGGDPAVLWSKIYAQTATANQVITLGHQCRLRDVVVWGGSGMAMQQTGIDTETSHVRGIVSVFCGNSAARFAGSGDAHGCFFGLSGGDNGVDNESDQLAGNSCKLVNAGTWEFRGCAFIAPGEDLLNAEHGTASRILAYHCLFGQSGENFADHKEDNRLAGHATHDVIFEDCGGFHNAHAFVQNFVGNDGPPVRLTRSVFTDGGSRQFFASTNKLGDHGLSLAKGYSGTRQANGSSGSANKVSLTGTVVEDCVMINHAAAAFVYISGHNLVAGVNGGKTAYTNNLFWFDQTTFNQAERDVQAAFYFVEDGGTNVEVENNRVHTTGKNCRMMLVNGTLLDKFNNNRFDTDTTTSFGAVGGTGKTLAEFETDGATAASGNTESALDQADIDLVAALKAEVAAIMTELRG